MNGWQLLRYDHYRLMPWKNGAGMTREILRFPPDEADFQWRLSMADVAQSGAFSFYPGYQRLLSVLRGSGMTLCIDAAPPVTLHAFDTQMFSGDSRVDSALIDGPLLDFNLIYRPDCIDATLRWHTPETQEHRRLTPGVTTLIFSAAPRLTLSCSAMSPLPLHCYDCAMLPPQPEDSALLDVTINAAGRWALLELHNAGH